MSQVLNSHAIANLKLARDEADRQIGEANAELADVLSRDGIPHDHLLELIGNETARLASLRNLRLTIIRMMDLGRA